MTGLTTSQVNQLLEQNGENILVEGKKRTLLQKLIEQFSNFLTLLLVAAAGLSFIIGEPVDGVLIIAIVVLNALFGIYQEAKAESAIAALKKMSVAKVRVLRDGVEQEVASNFIVPGDICLVEEGVKIAADGILIDVMNIELNESILTGESLSVSKQKGDEVFSGTIVSKGRGVFRVVKTGMQTKFGRIAHELGTIEDTETPLQIKLKQLTKTIGIIGIVAAVFVFIISILRGEAYFPTFLLAISLAVAVVPEGLPAVMTITLAIGVNEMSKKKSIVRKLSSIEALGSITLIATDKTGTLTTNKMKVKEVYIDDKTVEASQVSHSQSQLVLNTTSDQLRPALTINIIGSHAGCSIGVDGASQMALEDVSMMRSIRESTVLYPSDGISTYKLTNSMASNPGINYLRTTREKLPILYDKNEEFPIGGCKVHLLTNDQLPTTNYFALIIAAGITLHEALKAQKILEEKQIHTVVVDLYSVKPLDAKTIQTLAQKTKQIIVVEDHYESGGIGEAILSLLSTFDFRLSARFSHLCVRKEPRSGSLEELLRYEEIDAHAIVHAIKK